MSERRHFVFSVVVFFGLMLSGIAQEPTLAAPGGAPAGAPGQPMRPRGPRPAPTNIQALPKDITGDQVIVLMREYEGALGVECAYCHAVDPATKRINAASDANPMKETARTMIRMNAEINSKFLAALATNAHPAQVGCGTCHRGMSKPPAFVPKSEAPRGGAGMPASATGTPAAK